MDIKKLNKILELNKKGLSLREIEAIVKVGYETIRMTIKKYELKKVAGRAELGNKK